MHQIHSLAQRAQRCDADTPLLPFALTHAGLDLQNCYAPLAALPGLRPHMTRLTRLEVDLPCHYPSRIDPEVLQAVALLLLRPHPGAVQLQWLRFTNCAHAVQTELCMQSIRRSWLHSLG